MMPKGVFSQLLIVGLSVGLIFTYIKPKFEGISLVQADIATYKEKNASVSEVNKKLQSLLGSYNGVSSDNRRRLLNYMPDEIDRISITRDLLLITEQSGATYVSAAGDAKAEGGRSSRNNSTEEESTNILPLAHPFNLSVTGTYQEIKKLFSLLEQNHYPLEVHGFSISSGEDGLLSADISLVTYSYQTNDPGDTIEEE